MDPNKLNDSDEELLATAISISRQKNHMENTERTKLKQLLNTKNNLKKIDKKLKQDQRSKSQSRPVAKRLVQSIATATDPMTNVSSNSDNQGSFLGDNNFITMQPINQKVDLADRVQKEKQS